MSLYHSEHTGADNQNKRLFGHILRREIELEFAIPEVGNANDDKKQDSGK